MNFHINRKKSDCFAVFFLLNGKFENSWIGTIIILQYLNEISIKQPVHADGLTITENFKNDFVINC